MQVTKKRARDVKMDAAALFGQARRSASGPSSLSTRARTCSKEKWTIGCSCNEGAHPARHVFKFHYPKCRSAEQMQAWYNQPPPPLSATIAISDPTRYGCQ
ncbi:hypothetical protein D918_07984 [Trichuris suis]|nr:hypothetical protein D918_07984 [Trichuris suis]